MYKALATDIQRITDILPPLETTLQTKREAAIIAGPWEIETDDAMVKTGKLSVKSIEGKWESFLIQVVDHPLSGIDRALVICGSDPREQRLVFSIFQSVWVYRHGYIGRTLFLRNRRTSMWQSKEQSWVLVGEISRYFFLTTKTGG